MSVRRCVNIFRRHAGISRTPEQISFTIKPSIRYYGGLHTSKMAAQREQLDLLSNKLYQRNETNCIPSNRYTTDLVRVFIANELSKISGIDTIKLHDAILWNSKGDDSDFMIPVPKFGKQSIPFDQLAKHWAEKFPKNPYIYKVTSKGPFLKFFVDPKFLFNSVVPEILNTNTKYGSRQHESKKKVVVEFSSPNIAKPFHAGHLRSTIIGGFISNLYETMGWDVIRMNYLGDWGKQFGLLAVGYAKYGNQHLLDTDPINHLFDIYVRINKDKDQETQSGVDTIDTEAKKYFKKMETNDPEALKLWKTFRSLSIDKYVDTYARLGIHFDVYSGESHVPKEKMENALNIFEQKGLLEESQGATVIDLTKIDKKLGKTIIKKSDGTTLYLTRDVGAALQRYEEYHFDKMIYVIATQQDLYTSQLFQLLKYMNFPWANTLEHINFGMVKGMSTRKGTVVFLDNILEDAKEKVLTIMKNNPSKYSQIQDPEIVADSIGVSAIMIQDMQSKRINNYKFEWNRMLSFEGDTGPYLQYAHSRLYSIAQSHEHLSTARPDFDLLREKEAESLIRLLSQYPDVLESAMSSEEPCTIVTYLFKVAHQVSSCYKTLWVTGQSDDIASARLALYNASRQVLHNGMSLLGLTPVNRM
ncbi:hypothetical protein C6P45_002631 [Maudiozyma exigua]|uniref:arginine--tRNA ligase n=1 Tax=Maudiozyma exigua TaxID=34358 RepID=A0A9P6VW40_MAUEX|nr:hypothetical protein C6P45_002631 [Kazachstania exigua]